MPYVATKSILLIAALIGAVVGSAILISPVGFHGTTGIELAADASLMSEIRSPGAALLGLALVMFFGAFEARLTFTALVIGTVLYLSYGFARIFSMATDGMPHAFLIIVAALELVIGFGLAQALRRYPAD